MKPSTAFSLMMILGAGTAAYAFALDRDGLAVALGVLSFLAVLMLQSVATVWKPWFMDGIEYHFPDHSLFAIQAAAFEALALAALFSAAEGWTIVVLRLVGFFVQLVTAGRLTANVATPTDSNENSRKSPSGTRTGDARK